MPAPYPCIDCGRPIQYERSLCGPCGRETLAECAAEDDRRRADREAVEDAIDPREAAALIAEAEWESSPEGQAAWDRECELRREYGSRTPRRSLRDDHPSLTARERNPGLR